MIKRSSVALLAGLSLLGCPSEPQPKDPGPTKTPAATSQPTAAGSQPAAAGSQPAAAGAVPAGASVHFVVPQDGSTVFEDAQVVFGLTGMKVRPAGEDANDTTTGHHHVLIDTGPIAAGTIVPADATHIHFGKGQTEAMVKLTEGEHTLTMQLADGVHRSYGPKLATSIKVKVVKSPAEKKVFFEAPKDGAKVKSPVKVKFGLVGMAVQPAGEAPLDKTTGHHHIIIDGEAVPTGTLVPADATHIHFGKGQTEAEVPLSKGKHTLTMQLADGAHLSYGKSMSATITVEVE